MNVALPLAYENLEPAPVWGAFALLNSIPRPSGQEERVRQAIEELAQSRGLAFQSDDRGNLCVSVLGKDASPSATTVAIQAHLDMVCQKRPEVTIDFERDPITPRREGERIYATGTTLGADNGIGAAYMIALLEGAGGAHPPLELLFTVEEETGLFGAAHLDPAIVSARSLINLDSEEDDEITIGCAGGAGVTLRLPIERQTMDENRAAMRLAVSGLAGGHSGIQIGEPLGNALKIAGQVLDALKEAVPSLQLASLDGGTAHNAIPRDAIAVFVVPANQSSAIMDAYAQITAELSARWSNDEANLAFALGNMEAEAGAMTLQATEKVLGLVRALPHGVQKMSGRFAGKVQTSSNMAEVATHESEVELSVSNRSFVACDLADMQEHCATLGQNAGAQVEQRDGYPGWEPRADSRLRDQTAAAFANVTGKLPRVEVVHAGLECGLLSEKLPDLDAVSFGPTIRGAHTPEEWVAIPSVGRNWAVLCELLAALAR